MHADHNMNEVIVQQQLYACMMPIATSIVLEPCTQQRLAVTLASIVHNCVILSINFISLRVP